MSSTSTIRWLNSRSRVPIYSKAVLLLIIISADRAQSQIAEELPQNACATKTLCDECIRTTGCAWCFQPNFDNRRCFSTSPNLNHGCAEEYTINPHNVETILINETLSGTAAQSESDKRIVKISPQKVSLKLRLNEKHRLNIRYSQAEDYKVDLYYLMDLSKSMGDYRENLSKLGDLMSVAIPNITSKFRLGFGSYVDRVPTVPKNLEHSCESCNRTVDRSYGFRNHMPLSTDSTSFSENVRKAAFSGMVNATDEDNFHFDSIDAVMQALDCQEQIDWHIQAFRLLVLSTNVGYLSADVHRLRREMTTQNDGECHLDGKGEYDHSTVLDYPTISQVNSKVMNSAINVIFAVTPQQADVHGKLARDIVGSTIATLSEDSSNVVELVKSRYNTIPSAVELKDNATDAVKITYYSTCLRNGAAVPTPQCEGLKVGDTVSFTFEIVVTSCPQNPLHWNQTIEIYAVGTDDSLIVNLEMQCGCACEKPEDPLFKLNSPRCSDHGTLNCGICSCDESYFGQYCECFTESTFDRDCGRGECVCGLCKCYKRDHSDEVISGKYCECDNFSCDRDDGLLCGGVHRGICVCGRCNCRPGWTGDTCTLQAQ